MTIKELFLSNTFGRGDGVDIEFFTKNEPAFRKIMREEGMRAIYRGPRRGKSSMTRREDAYAVKFYSA